MKFDGSVMKVGNSLVMTIPKALCDNYTITKGKSLEIIATEAGLFIPLKPTQLKTIKEVLDEFSKSKDYRSPLP